MEIMAIAYRFGPDWKQKGDHRESKLPVDTVKTTYEDILSSIKIAANRTTMRTNGKITSGWYEINNMSRLRRSWLSNPTDVNLQLHKLQRNKLAGFIRNGKRNYVEQRLASFPSSPRTSNSIRCTKGCVARKLVGGLKETKKLSKLGT